MSSFGKRLKLLREILGLSQEELAKRLGHTRSLVSFWERGRYRSATLQTLRVFEEEFGVSMLWLTEGKSPIFSDERGLKYIRERIHKGKLLLLPEILFLIYEIKELWSSNLLPLNPEFCNKILQTYQFVSKKVQNPEHFGGYEHFQKIALYPPSEIQAVVDELLWLLTDGDFVFTEIELGIICSYLLPWGYYVALASTNKDRVPVPSVYFGDLSFLQSEIEITEEDIPQALTLASGIEFYHCDSFENPKCYISIPVTGKDFITIHMALPDIVEFILLMQNIPEYLQNEKEKAVNFTLGRYRLYTDFSEEAGNEKSYTLSIRSRLNDNTILTFNLSEEKLNALKQISSHISQKKKFLSFLFKSYIETYGFV